MAEPAFDFIACDLDGTLLGDDHRFSLMTRRTMKVILTQAYPGTTLILATGRNYFDVKKLCNQLIMYVNDDAGDGGCNGSANTNTAGSPNSVASPTGILPPISQLTYRNFYLIASNGAVARHAITGDIIYESCIDPSVAEALFNMLPVGEVDVNTNAYQYDDWVSRLDWKAMEDLHKESGLRYILCPEGPAAAASMSDAEKARIKNDADPGMKEITAKRVSPQPGIIDGHYGGITKLFFIGTPPALATLKQRILDAFGENSLSLTNSATDCLDVMAVGVNKGSTLHHLLQHIASPHSSDPNNSSRCETQCQSPLLRRTIAFGDGLNDAEMLSVVGKGCIMANCNAKLKDRCPQLEVVGPCTEDGVAKKLCEVFAVNGDLPVIQS